MRIGDFDFYCDLLKKKSGLTLTADKSYLLDSRLTPISKKWGYPSLEAMTMALRGLPDPKMITDVVEAMTTNETSFFRDGKPFEIFRQTIMPQMIKNRPGKAMRVWCAAASSGQEPYALAMTLKEMAPQLPPGWKTEILATDISLEILDQARAAEYSQFEVQRGLPVQLLLKYFEQAGDKWRLKKDISKMVTFKPFNLLDSMDGLGRFDIIFCRNVLIYFDEATQRDVLNRMARILAPDGALFLGGAETVIGYTDQFKLQDGARGLYVLKDAKEKSIAASA